MLKRFTFILLLFGNHLLAQVSFQPQVSLSAFFNVGTQENNISLRLNGGGVIENKSIALELNTTLGLDLFLTRYGRYLPNKTVYLETYGVIGGAKSTASLLFNSSDLALPYMHSASRGFHTFSGGGLGVKKTLIGGELKPLSNQQAIIIARVVYPNYVYVFRMQNDFRIWPILYGSGTDQGETGNARLGIYWKDNRVIQTAGFNVALITPVPDYSKNPDNKLNSNNSSRAVLHSKGPFKNLYHGNFFLDYGYYSETFRGNVSLGIDSQKLGGGLQNAFHDSFGLYPRFGWNVQQKSKLYFQIKAGVGHEIN